MLPPFSSADWPVDGCEGVVGQVRYQMVKDSGLAIKQSYKLNGCVSKGV